MAVLNESSATTLMVTGGRLGKLGDIHERVGYERGVTASAWYALKPAMRRAMRGRAVDIS
jgi:hypothetical protein